MNILPSFKSLKSAMGFGGDDDDEDDPKTFDDNKSSQNESSADTQKLDSVASPSTASEAKRKRNPKELKQLYIKNLKLQSELDKLRAQTKADSRQLQEQEELIGDLRDQIKLKQSLLTHMDKEQRVHQETQQQLRRELEDKDRQIESLQAELETQSAQQNQNVSALGVGNGFEAHNRRATMTPGGYDLDAMTFSDMSELTEAHTSNTSSNTSPDEKSASAASATSVSVSVSANSNSVGGLSLSDKFAQRSTWRELQSRGILLDDPTAPKSASLQEAHRVLRKRKASIQLDRMLVNRPNPAQLQSKNILKSLPAELVAAMDEANEADANSKPLVLSEIKIDEMDFGLDSRLAQRPPSKEVLARGILLDDPTQAKSPSLQKAERQLHRRKASVSVDKMLLNRPTPSDLAAQNIIDTRTAALFFGDAPDETAETADSGLATDNISRDDILSRLQTKIKQRPSVSETVARGILPFRTDTKLNYGLQAAQQQLHRRRASQQLEKLMLARPKPPEMEKRGILVSPERMEKKYSHKKKRSVDLEAGLKRRMSLSEMQGLGFLFMDHGHEFEMDPGSDADDDNDDFLSAEEQAMATQSVVGLFKHEPRVSKPLQQDFRGLEFEIKQREAELEDAQNATKRRDSVTDDNVNEADAQREFEPSALSKAERIARVGGKLAQRPSVADMRMRGLLLDHPSVSKALLERKRHLMKRRAGNKVSVLLSHRPPRAELESRNILLREDETLDIRRRHKRKASQTLDSKLQRRPRLMEEKEAQRQRRQSMDDSTFTPDYMKSIFDDDLISPMDDPSMEMGLGMHDLIPSVRFLNVGGFVIPLVSPGFMQRLAPEFDDDVMRGDEREATAELERDVAASERKVASLEQRVEELCEKLEDVEEDLASKDATLRSKDATIARLKSQTAELQQMSSRKSLQDMNALNVVWAERQKTDKARVAQLEAELRAKNERLSALEREHKAQQRRLGRLAVDSPFRRTSRVIESFLPRRPSLEVLMERGLLEEPREIEHQSSESEEASLRLEVVRLHELLAQNMLLNNRLKRDNETMRRRRSQRLNEDTATLVGKMQKHQEVEQQLFEQTLADLDNEKDKIEELTQGMAAKTQQIEELETKIRRLSTVGLETNVGSLRDRDAREARERESEMRRFCEWSRRLSWPESDGLDVDLDMESEVDWFVVMQRCLTVHVEASKERRRRFEERVESLKMEHLRDKERLAVNTMAELNRLRAQLKDVGRKQQRGASAQSQSSSSYLTFLWK